MIDAELFARIRRLFFAEHWKVGTIDDFYNPTRRHSHNRYLSPVDFERRILQEENAA